MVSGSLSFPSPLKWALTLLLHLQQPVGSYNYLGIFSICTLEALVISAADYLPVAGLLTYLSITSSSTTKTASLTMTKVCLRRSLSSSDD